MVGDMKITGGILRQIIEEAVQFELGGEDIGIIP